MARLVEGPARLLVLLLTLPSVCTLSGAPTYEKYPPRHLEPKKGVSNHYAAVVLHALMTIVSLARRPSQMERR